MKDDYEQRVCQKWRAHDVRVIDHHTKFPSLYQLLDDPEGVACDDFKEEFEKKECLAWKALPTNKRLKTTKRNTESLTDSLK